MDASFRTMQRSSTAVQTVHMENMFIHSTAIVKSECVPASPITCLCASFVVDVPVNFRYYREPWLFEATFMDI